MIIMYVINIWYFKYVLGKRFNGYVFLRIIISKVFWGSNKKGEN